MDRPFKVCVAHSIRRGWETPPNSGIHVQSVQEDRSERVLSIDARYDWFRGEYFVRLRVYKNDGLHVEALGIEADIPFPSG